MTLPDAPAGAETTARRAASFLDVLSVFRHRAYNLLMLGVMGTGLGLWVQIAAQAWLVFLITHSAFQLGFVGFIRGVVLVITSPFSGALADRVDRRRLLICSTCLSAATGTTLAILVATGSIQIWQVYLTAALDGLASSANLPVVQGMVYDVVEGEELTRGIAITSLASNLMRIVGPVLGGVLIGYVSLSAAFITQAAAYVVSLLVAVSLRPKPPTAQHLLPFLDSVRTGLAYSVRRPVVWRLMLLVVIPTLIVYPYVQFMPIFAKQVLHVGAQGYGFLNTGVGYGSIAGGLIVALLGKLPRRGAVMATCTVLYMLLIFVFALMHDFLAAFAVLVAAGLPIRSI